MISQKLFFTLSSATNKTARLIFFKLLIHFSNAFSCSFIMFFVKFKKNLNWLYFIKTVNKKLSRAIMELKLTRCPVFIFEEWNVISFTRWFCQIRQRPPWSKCHPAIFIFWCIIARTSHEIKCNNKIPYLFSLRVQHRRYIQESTAGKRWAHYKIMQLVYS